MKVSVVIPAYNEEEYITACLESLMNQTVAPDEIILVNNNSTDDTVKKAKQFPIRIVTENKRGIIPTRNKGFNESKYDIIARTDADTELPPDWIQKIKKNFTKNKKLIALSGPSHFHRLPDVIQVSNWQTKAVFNSYARILNHDCLYGPNMAIRKSAWELVKKEVCTDDKEVHEDIDLAIHLAPYGTIKFFNDIVVNSSFRRWRKLEPYFEYPLRGVKSIRKHKEFVLETKGKQLVKRVRKTLMTPINLS